jgi:hypothetical protein
MSFNVLLHDKYITQISRIENINLYKYIVKRVYIYIYIIALTIRSKHQSVFGVGGI